MIEEFQQGFQWQDIPFGEIQHCAAQNNNAGTPTFGDTQCQRKSSKEQSYPQQQLITQIDCLDPAVSYPINPQKNERICKNNNQFLNSGSLINDYHQQQSSFSSSRSSSCSTKFSENKLMDKNADESQQITSENRLIKLGYNCQNDSNNKYNNDLEYSDKSTKDNILNEEVSASKMKKKKMIVLASLEIDSVKKLQQQQQYQSLVISRFSPSIPSSVSKIILPNQELQQNQQQIQYNLDSASKNHFNIIKNTNTPKNQLSCHPKISKRSPLFEKFGTPREKYIENTSFNARYADCYEESTRNHLTISRQTTKTTQFESQDAIQSEGDCSDRLQSLLSIRWASERKEPYDEQIQYNLEKPVHQPNNICGRSNTLESVIPVIKNSSQKNRSSSISVWQDSYKQNQQQNGLLSLQTPFPLLTKTAKSMETDSLLPIDSAIQRDSYRVVASETDNISMNNKRIPPQINKHILRNNNKDEGDIVKCPTVIHKSAQRLHTEYSSCKVTTPSNNQRYSSNNQNYNSSYSFTNQSFQDYSQIQMCPLSDSTNKLLSNPPSHPVGCMMKHTTNIRRNTLKPSIKLPITQTNINNSEHIKLADIENLYNPATHMDTHHHHIPTTMRLNQINNKIQRGIPIPRHSLTLSNNNNSNHKTYQKRNSLDNHNVLLSQLNFALDELQNINLKNNCLLSTPQSSHKRISLAAQSASIGVQRSDQFN